MTFNLAELTFNLAVVECCVRVTILLDYLDLTLRRYISLHTSLTFTVLRFLSTTARAFYDDYSSCRPIFSSLLKTIAICVHNCLFTNSIA